MGRAAWRHGDVTPISTRAWASVDPVGARIPRTVKRRRPNTVQPAKQKAADAAFVVERQACSDLTASHSGANGQQGPAHQQHRRRLRHRGAPEGERVPVLSIGAEGQ